MNDVNQPMKQCGGATATTATKSEQPTSFPEAVRQLEYEKEELARRTAYNDAKLAGLKGMQRIERLENLFSYHAPTEEQQKIYSELRYLGRSLAHFILAHVPDGPDQSAALRKVREAVMTANAGVACGGKA